jgi:tripartite-type tricarboxylate transporter receptor subunit TctC
LATIFVHVILEIHMTHPSRRLTLAIAAASLLVCSHAFAQTASWPARSVKIIVPFGPGTGLDTMARAYAERLGEQTGGNFVVENREGAGGTIGAIATARAAADGYTIMFTAHAPFAVAPFMQAGTTYDPSADFTPITKVAMIPMVLVTGAGSSFKTFAEMAAQAKAEPGKLDYASSGVGTPSHLNVEVIKLEQGLDIIPVPYKSTSQAMTDLIGGQVPLYMPSFPAALPQMKAGKIRGLAIGSAQRSKIMPDIPTVAEVLGKPGMTAVVWYGFLAPKGLPADVVARLDVEISKAAASPRIVAAIDKIGADAVLVGPSNFAKDIQADATRSRELLRVLGVKPL